MKSKQHKMSAPGWYAEKEPTKDAPTEITIEIDGKPETLTAEDVVNLKAQQASATQKTQSVAAITQAAEKFGMTPEEYVAQAEGAFGVMGNLIDDGTIDNTGAKIVKTAPIVPADDKSFNLQPAPSKVEERVEKLEKLLSSIPGEFESLRQDQTHILRSDLQRQVQSKHPELNDDDVSRIFATAMNDPKKENVWQHAEKFVVKKTALRADDREKFATEFGIDLKQHDENKLRQASPEGAAAHIVKGKKLSFKRDSKDADSVSPMQAAKEFMLNRQ